MIGSTSLYWLHPREVTMLQLKHVSRATHNGAVLLGGKGVKGKTPSSSRWLQRQRKDPLVNQAAQEQYRSRSAFKLIELDDKYHFLKRASIVIDCGARPGSWSQVAAKRVGSENISQTELSSLKHGGVIAVDIEATTSISGVMVLDKCDVTDPAVHAKIRDVLGEKKADVVMSDMAPNASGNHTMDHQRIMELCRSAYLLAESVLKTGGTFICKLWQGSQTNCFKEQLKGDFRTVRECRLKATRKESSEVYIFAEHYQDSI